MGFRFSVDGLCKECGYFSQEFCDCCGRYICHDHMHFKPVEKTVLSGHVLCKDCFEKCKGPKWNTARSRLNPKFIHLFSTHYLTVPDS
jgi:hypothetical protein